MPEDFYEHMADEYAQMTDEPARLSREVPFLLREIRQIEGKEVLDIGCGTGAHARALAAEGLRVLGIDTSPAMIEKAQAAPRVEGATFELATLGDLAARATQRFDAILCLGNTLPHLVTEDTSLAKVSRQIAPLLRRGGIVIGQIVNVSWVEAGGVRLQPVRSWTEAGREVLLTRHYINTGGSNLLMLVSRMTRRPGETTWKAETFYQYLQKIMPVEIERAFESGPWGNYRAYGGWAGEPLTDASPSVVFVTSRR
ncbi:MAG: methyltransferase domain-containing protein [Candidatus Sumerlaeia bacterium]|nr:methyltransferase domain-containing protein [Candidatus Sumerlaeia bacterium]